MSTAFFHEYSQRNIAASATRFFCFAATMMAMSLATSCSEGDSDPGEEQPTGATPTPGTYRADDTNTDVTIVVNEQLRWTSLDFDLWCDTDAGGYGREGSGSPDRDVSSGYFFGVVENVRYELTWTDAETISGSHQLCPEVYVPERDEWTGATLFTATLQ